MATGNFNQIAHEIVEGALAYGVSTAEFIENCGGIEAAIDEIVRWYIEDEGQYAELEDVYGESLDPRSPGFRRYIEAGLS